MKVHCCYLCVEVVGSTAPPAGLLGAVHISRNLTLDMRDIFKNVILIIRAIWMKVNHFLCGDFALAIQALAAWYPPLSPRRASSSLTNRFAPHHIVITLLDHPPPTPPPTPPLLQLLLQLLPSGYCSMLISAINKGKPSLLAMRLYYCLLYTSPSPRD